MTYNEAVNFCKNTPELAATIVMELAQLKEELAQARTEIKRLQDIIDKDSSNSSKPPSTDNKFTRPTRKNKKVSNKNRGGQKGHSGHTLKMVDHPDKVVILETPACSCGQHLGDLKPSKVIIRQVFDLPEIKMEVTQFEQHTKVCPHCNSVHTQSFPDNVTATTQYGNSVKSFIAYCNTYQMIPYERISEMIEDLTSHKLSQGTLYNTLKRYYDNLEDYEASVKSLALKEKVLCCDETGVSVKGDLHWVHTVSSSTLTYYAIHKKKRICCHRCYGDTAPL